MRTYRKNSDRFAQGFMAYLTANSGWDGLCQIAAEYPEILSRRAELALQSFISQHSEDREIAAVLTQRRDFLKRCRLQGVKRAYQSFCLDIGPDAPQALRAILDTLCQMPSEHRSVERAQLYRRALELLDRATHPYVWGVLQYELGTQLSYTPDGDQSGNSELAIAAFERSLDVRTLADTPVERAESWRQLGRAFIHRILGTKRENIESAISAYRHALESFDQDLHPEEWGGTLIDLAHALVVRETGDPAENVGLALSHLRQVLQVLTKEECPAEWAMAQMNLALALMEHSGSERDGNYEQAIAACQRALEVRTAAELPAERAMTLRTLARAYGDRVRGDRAGNIEQAIAALEEANKLYTQLKFTNESIAATCDLAKLYQMRISGNESDNIEESIKLYEKLRKEVINIQQNPIQWANSANGLVAAFVVRMRGDREENLERGIELLDQAIAIYDTQSMLKDAAITRINLANIYRIRIRGNKDSNTARAISLIEQALQDLKREQAPGTWAFARTMLAAVYNERIVESGADDTQRIVDLLQQALQVYTRTGWPHEWAQATTNLASALCQAVGSEKAESIERAITLLRDVLEYASREQNPVAWARTMRRLGIAYHERVHGDRAANAAQAAQCWELALEELNENTALDEYQRAASNLAFVCMEQQRWQDAAHHFRRAIGASEARYRSSLLRAGQAGPLADIGKISRNAAYALARAGRLRDAVVLLELGRARALSEAMTRERADLEGVAQKSRPTYLRYQSVSMRIDQIEAEEREASLLSDERDKLSRISRVRVQMQQAREELDEIIRAIRLLPGYEGFLKEPSWDDCAAAVTDLSRDAIEAHPPLVYLVTVEQGSLALLLHAAGAPAEVTVEALWLDDFGADALMATLARPAQDGTYEGFMASVIDGSSAELADALAEILPVLGRDLVAPVAARLRELRSDSVLLIPCGHLNLLPLHAAPYRVGDRESCLLDEAAVSFSPSARAVVAARRRLRDDGDVKLGGIAVGFAPAHPRYLPYARFELEAIAQHVSSAGCTALYEQQATKESVLALLPQVNHAHFSCHGSFDAVEPLSSTLELVDGPLTLHEVLTQGSLSDVRLAVLSACQTAVSDFAHLPEEVIGWPSAFLQAGAAAVVGTLWSVNSISTALLMVKFYELYLKGDGSTGCDPMQPARALCRAQTWLRSLTAEEANLQLGSAIYAGVRHPFGAPQYWAPFVLVGA